MDSSQFDRIATGVAQGRLSRRRALRAGAAGVAVSAFAKAGFGRAAAAQEATPAAPPEWEEVDQLLAAAAPTTALLAAELVDGVCQPVHGFNADAVMPVASSFKLWALGTLALEIQAGRTGWEEEITIERQHKSVPGGDLRFVPDGSVFTVRYVAERMMQKSDNTATDHIMALVGRENIEQTMAAMGHHDPSLNIPLFMTREFALLKLAAPPELQERYLAADVEERRRILAEEVGTMPEEALADLDQTAPIAIDTFQWFATREDLCHTMAWLWSKAQEPGMRPVTEVIALDTPIRFNGEVWPYVGYKGGSELGVLSGTWLLQRAGGRHFVYSVGLMNPEAGIDMAAAVAAMEAGRDRLALTP